MLHNVAPGENPARQEARWRWAHACSGEETWQVRQGEMGIWEKRDEGLSGVQSVQVDGS